MSKSNRDWGIFDHFSPTLALFPHWPYLRPRYGGLTRFPGQRCAEPRPPAPASQDSLRMSFRIVPQNKSGYNVGHPSTIVAIVLGVMFTTFQDGLDSFKTSNWSLTQEAPRMGLVSILFLILADLSSPISAGPFGHVLDLCGKFSTLTFESLPYRHSISTRRHQQSLTHFDIVLRKVYCRMYIDHLQRQSDCFAVSTSRSLQATGLLVCLVRCADIFLRKLD
jgi:hypothetical protein